MESRLYYRLANIKSVYLSHEYHNEGLKSYIRDNYFTHLFCIFQFEEIIIDNMHVIINEKDYHKIVNQIKPFIKKENESGRIKPIELSDQAFYLDSPSNSYIIGRFTKNFVANNSKKGSESILKSAFKYKRHLRNLKKMEDANMVVSLDFEYNGLSFNNVSEVGISIYFPKTQDVVNHHYIIEGCENTNSKKQGLRQSFHFGRTIIAPRADVLAELKKYIREADYLIAHDINNEMQILNIKPDWNRIIDTKYCELTLDPQDKYLSLTETLRKHDISCSHLHNAGNDAAYALLLARTMYDEIKEVEITHA